MRSRISGELYIRNLQAAARCDDAGGAGDAAGTMIGAAARAAAPRCRVAASADGVHSPCLAGPLQKHWSCFPANDRTTCVFRIGGLLFTIDGLSGWPSSGRVNRDRALDAGGHLR